MFFTPPKVIETRAFARLPDVLNAAAADNEWVRGQPLGMPAQSLLEGPSFDRDGNLWCVDLVNGRIFCISPAGVLDMVAQYDGWPNGLKICRDGRVFIAGYKHGTGASCSSPTQAAPPSSRRNLTCAASQCFRIDERMDLSGRQDSAIARSKGYKVRLQKDL